MTTEHAAVLVASTGHDAGNDWVRPAFLRERIAHMDQGDLHVGRSYAYPTNPGPLAGPETAARVQVIESRLGGRVLVRILDPGPRAKYAVTSQKFLVPGAIVEVGVRDLACPWSQWPKGHRSTG